MVIATRERTAAALQELGLQVLPSKANFVFARHNRVGGDELYRKLKAMGVLVRHFSRPELDPWLRITIGTRQQMDILLDALQKIIKE